AWSELPRAQVMAKRGGTARSDSTSRSTESRFRASWRATTAGALAASANSRVRVGSVMADAELGDEVVGVAAVVGLAELDRAAVGQEADALDQEAGVTLARLQQLRLLGAQQQGAQPLQGAHRAVAGGFQRLVQRVVHRL